MKSKVDNNNNEDTLMYKRSPRHDDKNNNHVINISNKKIFYDSDKLNMFIKILDNLDFKP